MYCAIVSKIKHLIFYALAWIKWKQVHSPWCDKFWLIANVNEWLEKQVIIAWHFITYNLDLLHLKKFYNLYMPYLLLILYSQASKIFLGPTRPVGQVVLIV